MSITNTAARVRLESGAKNGTLSTQGVLNADQIKFDTAITTNNGNLVASPTFDERQVILRLGETDEERGLINSVDVDGLTCTMYADWDSPPASGDTYQIGYKLVDVQTVAGCNYESDSGQWAMAKRLVIGVTTTTFGFLGLSHGEILRLHDTGPTTTGLQVNTLGWLMIGTEKQRPNGLSVAERGGALIFTHNSDNETVMDIDGHAFMYEFAMYSAFSSSGVRGLKVTHAAGATVGWSRFQGSGMDTPYKKRVKRYQDIDGNLLLSITDLKASAPYNGHLQSELDEILFEYIDDAGESGANEVMITLEDA